MKISEFVLQVLNDRTNSLQKMEIAKVTDEEAKAIFEETGVNLKGYTHIVDSFGVKHTISEHGTINELKRGQIPVTVQDFDTIFEVIKNYDEVSYEGKNGSGRAVLMYKKKVNGHIFYLEEIRSIKKKEGVIQTMYLKPNKKGLNPKVKP